MKYAFFAYWYNVDPNMLETCIASLSKVSNCVIYIATDGVPDEVSSRLARYKVNWLRVPLEKVRKRRATCKIEALNNLVKQCDFDDVILVADVDVVFIKDPFVPFWTNREMDLGLTTRGYAHAFPINGGIFYIRCNPKMRLWLSWHLQEIYKPTWEPYVTHRKKWNHAHFGLDWSVGQDFLVANWRQKDVVKKDRGVTIIDVGPQYNYCPPTDTMGQKAFEMVWEALEKRNVSVIHLKSQLKSIIYQRKFPYSELNFKKGKTAWA